MSQRPDTEATAALPAATRLDAVLAAAPPPSLGAPLAATPATAAAFKKRDGDASIDAVLRQSFEALQTGEDEPGKVSVAADRMISAVNNRNATQDQIATAITLLAELIKELDKKFTLYIDQTVMKVATEVSNMGAAVTALEAKQKRDATESLERDNATRKLITDAPWSGEVAKQAADLQNLDASVQKLLGTSEEAGAAAKAESEEVTKLKGQIAGLESQISSLDVRDEIDKLQASLQKLPSPEDLEAIIEAVKKQPKLQAMNEAVYNAKDVAGAEKGEFVMPKAQLEDALPDIKAPAVKRNPSLKPDANDTAARPKSVEALYEAMMAQSQAFL